MAFLFTTKKYYNTYMLQVKIQFNFKFFNQG